MIKRLCPQNEGILMWGHKTKKYQKDGVIADYTSQINSIDNKRALEVSAFYNDLESSIKKYLPTDLNLLLRSLKKTALNI